MIAMAEVKGTLPGAHPTVASRARTSRRIGSSGATGTGGIKIMNEISSQSSAISGQKKPALYLAQYDSPDALVHAANKVRQSGYTSWDCHTPYPLHGLDDAMGLKTTRIGIVSFVCAMVGVASAVLMIQYMNNFDYPLIVGGKPPGAFPSMVPIMLECGILLCGFGTLFGLLHMCRLPRHHHPIFESGPLRVGYG